MRPEQSFPQVTPANENEPGAPVEPRSFGAPEPGFPGAPQLSVAEQTAMGLLRCGRSFAEAAESAGLNVSQVMALWNEAHAR